MENDSPRRILVVDDEPEILDLCQRILRSDYDVVLAHSLAEGLELSKDGSFCAAIVDQFLEKDSGVEFLASIQETYPDMGRILITGHASQERIIEAINKGQVHAYVLKPWSNDEFTRVVDHVVEVARLRMRLSAEHARYRRLVFDSASNLPTRALVEGDAARWLESDGTLGILVIDASEVWAVQTEIGTDAFVGLRDAFVSAIVRMHGNVYRREDILAVDEVESPLFCILLSQPRTQHLSCGNDVELLARRLLHAVSEEMLQLASPIENWWPRVSVGFAYLIHNPTLPITFQLRDGVRSARIRAGRLLESDDQVSHRSELERIIVNRELRTVFQPIVDLTTRECIGYEALSRGPSGTRYESPAFLLRLADRVNLSVELDRAFRTTALSNVPRMTSAPQFFINTIPMALCAKDMRPVEVERQLHLLGVEPEQLVLEFSERYVMRNQGFLQNLLQDYRSIGIKLAIDDVGVGYSGLERIAKLEPDYLKVDMWLVRDIHEHAYKRATVSALVNLANEVGALTIGEGIEVSGELGCLQDLGVGLGQGYLLGRPSPIQSE
ncbi:MAG: hypothetical protein A2289_04020 [Deltaproteobacteria bacterium RIFOXYA12_FULL_58_15]|nr:MAG: hypothetical protein A2289_04020 [Deltaproteobacteria bacterium RIFOXYA12_FULL_58_15]